jgi:hypothetical protein
MVSQELWAAVGNLVVQPAKHPERGINADFLMMVAGSVLGALIARTGDKEALARLTVQTCIEELGRPLSKFADPLPELPLELASECIVRLMPDLEKLSPRIDEVATTLAAWVGMWAAQFDQSIPAEEFIAVCWKFAETASKVDSWSMLDEKTGDHIATWAAS